jgi:hypothetical protein
MTLPTKVHEKLARNVRPECELETDVFKLNLKYVNFGYA